jgi:hypothetical protein
MFVITENIMKHSVYIHTHTHTHTHIPKACAGISLNTFSQNQLSFDRITWNSVTDISMSSITLTGPADNMNKFT